MDRIRGSSPSNTIQLYLAANPPQQAIHSHKSSTPTSSLYVAGSTGIRERSKGCDWWSAKGQGGYTVRGQRLVDLRVPRPLPCVEVYEGRGVQTEALHPDRDQVSRQCGLIQGSHRPDSFVTSAQVFWVTQTMLRPESKTRWPILPRLLLTSLVTSKVKFSPAASTRSRR